MNFCYYYRSTYLADTSLHPLRTSDYTWHIASTVGDSASRQPKSQENTPGKIIQNKITARVNRG